MSTGYAFADVNIDGVRYRWKIPDLWAQAKDFDIELVSIAELNALDSNWRFEGHCPSLRDLLPHVRRIIKADLSYPILLMRNGHVLDGGHRIARAVLLGFDTIPAKRFPQMPMGWTLETP